MLARSKRQHSDRKLLHSGRFTTGGSFRRGTIGIQSFSRSAFAFKKSIEERTPFEAPREKRIPPTASRNPFAHPLFHQAAPKQLGLIRILKPLLQINSPFRPRPSELGRWNHPDRGHTEEIGGRPPSDEDNPAFQWKSSSRVRASD